MSLRNKLFSGRGGFYALAFFSALAFFPAHGQALENVNCVYKGGSRQITIDYSGGGCRTLYNPGNGQHREIAWAKSNLALCKQVANGVMSKSGRAAWSCSPDIAVSSGHDQARHAKFRKAVRENSGDDAILKSSER